MQSKQAPKWRIKSFEIKDYLNLWVVFNDSTQGNVTINPNWLPGVFALLNNPNEFKKIFICHGAITWENGLDLDSKTIYDAIKAQGYCVIS
jgi:hypothetical protein